MAVASTQTVVTSEWTPARIFVALSALVHIPIALVGFIQDRTFPIGADAAATAGSEHIFGVLETNGWHTLGALIVGAVSLYATMRPRYARATALVLGITHIALFTALVIWSPSTFWIASNTADQVIHSMTAIGGTVTGSLTPRDVR